MKILITGGAGFIASHISDAYIKRGHNVVVIDNLSTGKKEYLNGKASFYQADIRDRKIVEEIFQKEKPEVLNHHAAQISVRYSVEDPRNDASINILGLLNLLEAGKPYLKKVIFASSGGVVYGEADKMPTPEDYVPLCPLSPYGVAKLAGEYYLNYYQKNFGIRGVSLRYSNVYGPRQNPHGEAGVVAIFSKKVIKGEAPVINGDGLQTRDYVYVGDVVSANQLVLAKDVSGPLNIGTGIETNVVGIWQKIAKITGTDIKAVYGPAKQGEQKRSVLYNSLAREKLAWQPSIDLESGLKETVKFFKKNE